VTRPSVPLLGRPPGGIAARASALNRRRLAAAAILVLCGLALGWAGNQARLAAQLAGEVSRQYRTAFGARPQDLAPRYEDVSFPSRTDHLTLRGWLLHAATPTERSVVFLHGSDADRAISPDLARQFVQRGYDVLLFDLRGCGKSDGDHQTFGNLEQRDVLGAHDFMVARGYAPARLTLLGLSAGAHAMLMAAPQLADVAALVSDSAFDAAGPVLDRFWESGGVPSWQRWLALQFGRRDGLDPSASAAGVIRTTPRRALLFIHARGDGTIPVANAQALRAASANPQSQLFLTDGRAHMATFNVDRHEYMRRVLSFIDNQIDARAGSL
jgi:pimeloyl-ACP methyl ester carboxylesterase